MQPHEIERQELPTGAAVPLLRLAFFHDADGYRCRRNRRFEQSEHPGQSCHKILRSSMSAVFLCSHDRHQCVEELIDLPLGPAVAFFGRAHDRRQPSEELLDSLLEPVLESAEASSLRIHRGG